MVTRRPIDTPARRLAVHESTDVVAAKHYARAYGIGMTRSRRVGSVTFNIGLRGAPDVASRRIHGTIVFTDEGRIDDVSVFGGRQGWVTLPELEQVFEFGALSPEEPNLGESPVEIVLEALPDPETPITGLIPLAAASTVMVIVPAPEELVQLVPDAIVADIGAPVPVTHSVAIRVVPTLPSGPSARPTLRDRQEAVRSELRTAKSVWGQFLIGLLLALAAVSVALVTVSGMVVPGSLVGLAGIAFVIAVGLIGSAIHTQDDRLERLHAVGLR